MPSAPLHVLLYRFLGWEDTRPEFAHLPLILRPDGNGKLSKRDGDRLGFPVFPLDWTDPSTGEISSGYREKGYYSEAFINMLAFLGWNPGTEKELYTLSELIEDFTLERVGKSGAKFDADKTNWYNQQFLRSKSTEELAFALGPHLEEAGIAFTTEQTNTFVELMKERAFFVADMMEGEYLFAAPAEYDEKTIRKKWKENSPLIVEELITLYEAATDFESTKLQALFMNYLEEKELGMGAAMPLLRVLITGQPAGPGMFDIMEFLGKQESTRRLSDGLRKIQDGQN
mgnify:FL=1